MAALTGVRAVSNGRSDQPTVVAEWRLQGNVAALVHGGDTLIGDNVGRRGLRLKGGDLEIAKRIAERWGVAMPEHDTLGLVDGAALLVGLLARYKQGSSSRMWAEPVGVEA